MAASSSRCERNEGSASCCEILDGPRQNGRRGWVQHQAVVRDLDLGFRVDPKRQFEVRHEASAEDIHATNAHAELAFCRRPGHRGRLVQGVQAVGKPAVNVNRLAVVRDSPYGGVLKRYGVLLQL